ncbi:MAG: large conductance mechanosensitive channel protein MscL [Acidobacteria bacterium]|nr:large conductance mechanosensitive channel protein MscL [Acidobacteriota bacterium]
MLQEFKEFALKGNVIDLAVGVIIGGAFGKITASLVEDIINPVLGLALGKVDLTQLYIALDGKTYENLAAAKKAGAAVLAYGNFINIVVQFIIVAFAIFIVIKQMNRLTKVSGENLPK